MAPDGVWARGQGVAGATASKRKTDGRRTEDGRKWYGMFRYIIRRLLQAVLMLFIMSIAFFVLIHLMPGGPDQALGLNNPRITGATRAAIRARYGLDDPLPVQYFHYITQALQ